MLKKLKSLFIIEEGNPQNKDNPPAKESSEDKTSSEEEMDYSELDMESSDSESRDPIKPDPKFVEILLKAVDAANVEGFDYLEFKQSLQSLNKMNMDEPTKYKSAFAMAKTMGATPAKLVESASNYIRVLQKEESKFNDALQNQKKVKIGGRKKDLEHLEKLILDKQKMIEKLKKEVEEHQNQLEQKSKGINEAARKVEATRDRFEQAYQIVLSQIQTDVEKIKQYLEE